MTDQDQTLQVGYSARSQNGSLALIAAFGVLLSLAWLADLVPGWLGVVGLIEIAIVLAVGIVSTICMRGSDNVLQLDSSGIHLGSAATVPWSDISELVVQPMKPTWFLGSRRTMVLGFQPRPGVTLPRLPDLRGRPRRRGARWTERLYGTSLVIIPWSMTATAEEIAGAARDLGGIDTRWIPHRALRKWLWVIAIGVMGGIVVATVRIAIHRLS